MRRRRYLIPFVEKEHKGHIESSTSRQDEVCSYTSLHSTYIVYSVSWPTLLMFVYVAVSISNHMASNGKIISDQWIGKEAETLERD
jgi:hypothetical protein